MLSVTIKQKTIELILLCLYFLFHVNKKINDAIPCV